MISYLTQRRTSDGGRPWVFQGFSTSQISAFVFSGLCNINLSAAFSESIETILARSSLGLFIEKPFLSRGYLKCGQRQECYLITLRTKENLTYWPFWNFTKIWSTLKYRTVSQVTASPALSITVIERGKRRCRRTRSMMRPEVPLHLQRAPAVATAARSTHI